MRLDVSIIRKPRSLGLVPKTPLTREQLDEIALAIQQTMLEHTHVTSPDAAPMPFCAFNGGRDTWFDIGNKLIGVQILQEFIGCEPARCLHVGDQFLSTGNDFATRTACNTNWIINPQETHDILVELNALLSLRK
ncbi:IMP-specific 5-nucleotidase [Ramicandelaber brevisporus]|nr:IMP-specific 5-nucleotidase [Ramicandelaber brevisporus]